MDESSRISNHPAAAASAASVSGGPTTSRWAVASLLAGLGSGLCLCCSGLIGLICGVAALVSIRRSQGALKGRGLAIAGIVLSVVLPLGVGAVMGPRVQQEVLKSQTVQVHGQAVFAALQVYAEQHDGLLPPDLETLVKEELLQSVQLQGPEGEPGFFRLIAPGEKLADQAADDVLIESSAWKLWGARPHVQILADGSVKMSMN